MSGETSEGAEKRYQGQRGRGVKTLQSRIRIYEALRAAGSQGCETDDLVALGMAEGMTLKAVKTMLFKEKREGRLFGKGQYFTRGMVYRYFETAQQCEAYSFGPVPTEQERKAKNMKAAAAREKAKLAAMTPEELAAHRAKRAERLRAYEWRKRGYEVPPPKRVVKMTAEQRAEMSRKRLESYMESRRQKALEKRLAKEAAKLVGRLPGRRQVVADNSVAAPVAVPKRPVLVGEPIITSQTRVTVAPAGVDYRYHVDPASVERVFSALPVGRYLEEAEAV